MYKPRVITVDGKCHKDCEFYKECKGFYSREKRCPQWAVKSQPERIVATSQGRR